MNFCGLCGARLEAGVCPSCRTDWARVPAAAAATTIADDPDDDVEIEDDPVAWRRSQMLLAALLAVVLVLAGLGVALWRFLDEDEASLAIGPQESSTSTPASATTIFVDTTLPAPVTTSAMTLPSTTRPELTPRIPGAYMPAPQTSILVLPPVPPSAGGTPATQPAGPAPSPGGGGGGGGSSGGGSPAGGGGGPPPDPATTEPQVATGLPQVPSTDAAATDPPTTPTQPSTTTTLPPPPTDPPLVGRGSPVILQDPMPSGAPYGAIQGAFGVAQQLVDQLVNGRYIAARALAPSLAGTSDGSLASTYGGFDRGSAVLVDAWPDGSGYALRLGFLFVDGGSTSVYCGSWWADGAGVAIPSGLRRVAEYDGAHTGSFAIESTDLNQILRSQCG